MPPQTSSAAPPFEVEVYYDGHCPLCLREVTMLRRLDRRGNIRFTNIAASDFNASALGLDQATLMKRIHGRLPDGELIEGVEVFRRLYGAVGFRRMVGFSRAPGVAQLLNVAYDVFARHRLRLTGRCEPGGCAIPEP